MRRPSHDHLIRLWLAAERAGRESAAEEAFAELLATCPGPEAPPWLVGAVMERVPRAARWTLERLAALLFVACGVAVVFSRWWFPFAVDGLTAAARWTASFSLAGWLAAGLEDLASLWTLWSEVGRVGRLVGSSPEGLVLLAGCSLAMLAAARLLHRLLRERSSAHVR